MDESTDIDPWVVSSAASVLLALFIFFVYRDREVGIFVGLWAPTILGFANYSKQKEIQNTINRAMKANGVIERVGQIVQSG